MIDLKTQIAGLVKLQALDTEIYSLNSEKQAKPQEIKEIEMRFEAKKQHLAELEKNLLELQKQRKDAELELASKEEAARKLHGQLSSLKTNKEYQAMLQQIQDAKADCSVIEDKVLQLFDKADEVRLETEREKARLKEDEMVFSAEKKKVEDRLKEIDDKLAQLEAQREQALLGIDPKVLSEYERILKSRGGLAIVTVADNSCKGCNMFVPPQVINLIKMYEHIITCEMCNRILFIRDE